ncbi:8803_t:CDS:2 [Paraglomus brasilianum]|uniref:8803_t:CDS:1 n=1 Tax=Paraglomus brasilianum TaxID=144538 RepID=A0A9N8ZHY6_9GLOM|nr:8803_t:CDS:2 [Paraglomus brasilianum]
MSSRLLPAFRPSRYIRTRFTYGLFLPPLTRPIFSFLKQKPQNEPLSDEEVRAYLRESIEDENYLKNNKNLREFEFPGAQPYDIEVNMANWDVFLYTRDFPTTDSERSLRHVSKVLTYPITIAAVLHKHGPFTLKNRLTPEGLKSLLALRSTLYPMQENRDIKHLRPAEIMRIFIVGSRAEGYLPTYIYLQLSHLFPMTAFHIYFIGPQALPPRHTQPFTQHLNQRLSFSWSNLTYHDHHDSLYPFDPYMDVFFLFSPGFGQPDGKLSWAKSLKKILGTKCAVFITGYDAKDMADDVRALEAEEWPVDEEAEINESSKKKLEYDWLLTPGENPFRSLKRDINANDVRDSIFSNWGIFGIRGKKYEIKEIGDDYTLFAYLLRK